MSIKDCIVIEAQSMESGTSTRIQCPFCNEHSMSLTLEEGFVLYNCFRASCNNKGRINIPGIFAAWKEEKGDIDSKEHEKQTLYLRAQDWHNDGVFNMPSIPDKYPPITVSMLNLGNTTYNFEEDIFVTELDDRDGYMCKRQGELGKILLQGKSRNYLKSGCHNNGLELYANPLRSVFICEDIISAMWIRQVTNRNTFCLFGTSVTAAMYSNTLSSYNNWIWCLDNDTNYGSSQKYEQMRDAYPTHNHTFLVLTKDPKDHTKEELLKALSLEQYE